MILIFIPAYSDEHAVYLFKVLILIEYNVKNVDNTDCYFIRKATIDQGTSVFEWTLNMASILMTENFRTLQDVKKIYAFFTLLAIVFNLFILENS